MSLPTEQRNALKWGWKFLFELIDRKKGPKVPESVRVTASHVLRHYPGPAAIDMYWKPEARERRGGK